MKSNTLPHSAKKIGLIIFLTAITIQLTAYFLLPEDSAFNTIQITRVCKVAFFVGLLIFIRSAEKKEDEYVQYCRYRAYQFAFIATIIYGIFRTYKQVNNSFFTTIDMIIAYQLLLYIVFFHLYKAGIANDENS
ncbi:MAG TPA: hypothetical protein PKA77_13375 [Chitinophagaceae bacterium]|jgi:hypothetical protein|nr:hypothetical protein [Chitinophagaceae bacterium]HMU59166.1 hypothetical protein [Chitinophagaceae bacterium]